LAETAPPVSRGRCTRVARAGTWVAGVDVFCGRPSRNERGRRWQPDPKPGASGVTSFAGRGGQSRVDAGLSGGASSRQSGRACVVLPSTPSQFSVDALWGTSLPDTTTVRSTRPQTASRREDHRAAPARAREKTRGRQGHEGKTATQPSSAISG